MLKLLKNGKAPGPDGFRKEDFNLDLDLIGTILAHIFQYSLDLGRLPSSQPLAITGLCL